MPDSQSGSPPGQPSHPDLRPDTLAVRSGTVRSQFGEHSEALFLTSSYVFDSAARAAAVFSGAEEGFVYSRFSNPTVRMFEQRLAVLEGGEDCAATASGMGAILAICLGHLKAGDHVLCSASVFGATVQMFASLMARFGITTDFLPAADLDAWRAAAAARPGTRLMFCESPSNPLSELVDLAGFAALAREIGALSVVDNCFCTPILQQPLKFGIDVVMHSGTKYLDGQGRVLGGAVVGRREFIRNTIVPVLRTAGPSMAPFNAWVLLKGLETLPLRVRAQAAAAQRLAEWLQAQPGVVRVHHAGLASHPQHELALRQQSMAGAVLAFEISGVNPAVQRERAWQIIDNVRLMSITGNLGDTRTTITHPATTTHGRLSPEARERAGIGESLIRVAVGLEDVEDLMGDLRQALTARSGRVGQASP